MGLWCCPEQPAKAFPALLVCIVSGYGGFVFYFQRHLCIACEYGSDVPILEFFRHRVIVLNYRFLEKIREPELHVYSQKSPGNFLCTVCEKVILDRPDIKVP